MTIRLRLMFLLLLTELAVLPLSLQATEKIAVPTEARAFLKLYCVKCHGIGKQDGKLSLHQTADVDLNHWKDVLTRLENQEMPPEKAQQPADALRQQIVQWLRDELQRAGVKVAESERLHPSQGNRLNHDLLFDSKSTGSAATRGRLWRLTGQGYEEFVQSLNMKYRLGFRTYGHHRIRAPWEFTPQSQVQRLRFTTPHRRAGN